MLLWREPLGPAPEKPMQIGIFGKLNCLVDRHSQQIAGEDQCYSFCRDIRGRSHGLYKPAFEDNRAQPKNTFTKLSMLPIVGACKPL
ncbi:hypothetical protein IQ270_00315 [Microcoleus sp. LEGE 07076]|uniref:hypothetical protein n=1 Tax=Microcoleus sp. LEGE 07076 TaxID=915322 RepID=UPI00188306D5|nr:hypothetical protein [Microcoleus sp. LEGE 07076]MBE9183206.1 hypothetical protein [Microcoleus sp. LEGE 07076]